MKNHRLSDHVIVYGLTLVDDSTIRYVGITTTSLAKRLHIHARAARKDSKLPCACWIKKHGIENIRAVELEVCISWEAACQAERDWIIIHRCLSIPILNVSPGGDGYVNYIMTDEHRRKISKALTGYVKSASHRAAISASKIGKSPNISPDVERKRVMKIKKSLTGRSRSDECKIKISETLRGRLLSADHKAKISAGHQRRREQRQMTLESNV
jgi:hypothetical protein